MRAAEKLFVALYPAAARKNSGKEWKEVLGWVRSHGLSWHLITPEKEYVVSRYSGSPDLHWIVTVYTKGVPITQPPEALGPFGTKRQAFMAAEADLHGELWVLQKYANQNRRTR
jgi:hypothetical protein